MQKNEEKLSKLNKFLETKQHIPEQPRDKV
jgi:hypothetical protein